MLQSIVTSYDELPLFLNAKKLSEVLGLDEKDVKSWDVLWKSLSSLRQVLNDRAVRPWFVISVICT